LNPIDSEPSFRTCPGCGNLTPAENPRCVHCGLGSIEAIFAEHKAASDHRFLQALFTRSNPFTMIFIGINVGVFALMCLAGGFVVTAPDHAVLIGFGAKQNSLIAEQHQYWRLVTSIFIHIGFIHLFLNNYALWIIGQEIERIYGSSRFVFLYLTTGVLGSLGSYLFSPQATSAGASGAIFGLFGVMATFAFKYRREIPELLSREIKRRVLPIIAINLLFGFSVSIVDNAAHIGGLLSGIALALIVHYKRPNEQTTPMAWRALQIICMAFILISFVDAFRSYNGPQLRLSNLTRRPGPSVKTYFEHMEEASRLLGGSIRSFTAVVDSRNTTADITPLLDSVERGIRAVSSAPQFEPEADQYRKRLVDFLSEQKSILNRFSQSATKDWDRLIQEERELRDRYDQLRSDYGKWLPGFLKEHGYELRNNGDR
jgi:membrane associated rhomboid family serine protease